MCLFEFSEHLDNRNIKNGIRCLKMSILLISSIIFNYHSTFIFYSVIVEYPIVNVFIEFIH